MLDFLQALVVGLLLSAGVATAHWALSQADPAGPSATRAMQYR